MRHRPPTAPSLIPLEERLVPSSGLANPNLSLVLPAQLAKAYGVQDLRFTDPAGGEPVIADGAGQVIVIINCGQDRAGNFRGSLRLDQDGIHDNAEAYAGSDFQLFNSQFGLTQFGSKPGEPFYLIIGQDGFTPVSPPVVSPRSSIGGLEFSVDASYSHAMAPGASIIQMSVDLPTDAFALLPSVLASLDMAGYSINVTVFSMSYASGEFGFEYIPDYMGLQMSQLFTHSSFVVAAGDNGAGYQNVPAQTPDGIIASDTYDFYSMNYLSSLAGIIQVGGVSATPSQLADYQAQAWGHGILSNLGLSGQSDAGGGGGGGYSLLVNAENNYQYQHLALRPDSVPQDMLAYFQSVLPPGTSVEQEFIPPTDSTPRLGPDISLQADNQTGGVNVVDSWLLGADTPWLDGAFGGTSLATPLLAGLLAVANQGRELRGLLPLAGATEALPMMYRAPSNLLFDVTQGNNGFPAGPGFDLATGLGVPYGKPFIQYLAGATLQSWSAIAGRTPTGDSTVSLTPSDNPGQILTSFVPFPGFKGPLSLAQGDLNADQIPDLVVSTAGGGAPQVVAFDGLSLMAGGQTPLCSFFAFDQAFLGGTSVTVLPGINDLPGRIAVGAGPGGEPALATFHPDGTLDTIRYAFDQAFRGGLRLTSGDLNADGFFDIVAGVASGNAPHVVAFDGNSGSVLASYLAFTAGFSGGLNLAAGDVNADGFADIASGAAEAWSTVNIFSPKTGQQLANFYAGAAPQSKTGVRLALHDTQGLAVKDQLLASVGRELNTFTMGTTNAVVLERQIESPFADLTFGVA